MNGKRIRYREEKKKRNEEEIYYCQSEEPVKKTEIDSLMLSQTTNRKEREAIAERVDSKVSTASEDTRRTLGLRLQSLAAGLSDGTMS